MLPHPSTSLPFLRTVATLRTSGFRGNFLSSITLGVIVAHNEAEGLSESLVMIELGTASHFYLICRSKPMRKVESSKTNEPLEE